MLLTIMSHKLRMLLCCSPKSFLQPKVAWVYFWFQCQWDTSCFLHLRLNSIFVPDLRCRWERCAHLCLVSAVHCLHESPFKKPVPDVWGNNSDIPPNPIYQPAQISPSLRELILLQHRCGGAAIRAATQSHVAGTSRTTEMNELMGGLSGIKRGRRWREMRENMIRIQSVLLIHLNISNLYSCSQQILKTQHESTKYQLARERKTWKSV